MTGSNQLRSNVPRYDEKDKRKISFFEKNNGLTSQPAVSSKRLQMHIAEVFRSQR